MRAPGLLGAENVYWAAASPRHTGFFGRFEVGGWEVFIDNFLLCRNEQLTEDDLTLSADAIVRKEAWFLVSHCLSRIKGFLEDITSPKSPSTSPSG